MGKRQIKCEIIGIRLARNVITKQEINDIILYIADFLQMEAKKNFSLLICKNDEIQRLNLKFRQKDYATNVLSFPSLDNKYLGDIAISIEVIKKEADEQGKEVKSHFIHILVHGFLHLLGYDHKEDDERLKMEDLEIRILYHFGIQDPYLI